MNQSLLLYINIHKLKPLSESQQSTMITQSPLVSIITGSEVRKSETHTRNRISQTLVNQVGLFSIIACSLTDNIAANIKNNNLVGYLLKIRIIWKKTGLAFTLNKCICNLLQNGMIVNYWLEEGAEHLTRTNPFYEKLLVKV